MRKSTSNCPGTPPSKLCNNAAGCEPAACCKTGVSSPCGTATFVRTDKCDALQGYSHVPLPVQQIIQRFLNKKPFKFPIRITSGCSAGLTLDKPSPGGSKLAALDFPFNDDLPGWDTSQLAYG